MRKLLSAVVLAALAVPAAVAVADDEPMMMFVHTANDMEADSVAMTLRLVGVDPQTLCFSDRPERLAGHLTMDAYLDLWTQGGDDFAADPPNATLSIYEPGGGDNSLVVIEIDNPVLDGADLVYSYSVIEGTVPASGGPVALFIDMIGLYGPLRLDNPGVGVGFRGPGFLP